MDVRFDQVSQPQKDSKKILGPNFSLHDCKWHMVLFEN